MVLTDTNYLPMESRMRTIYLHLLNKGSEIPRRLQSSKTHLKKVGGYNSCYIACVKTKMCVLIGIEKHLIYLFVLIFLLHFKSSFLNKMCFLFMQLNIWFNQCPNYKIQFHNFIYLIIWLLLLKHFHSLNALNPSHCKLRKIPWTQLWN